MKPVLNGWWRRKSRFFLSKIHRTNVWQTQSVGTIYLPDVAVPAIRAPCFFFGCVCLFLGGTSTFIFNCKQARIFFGRASFRGFRQYRKARWRGVLGISSLNNKSVDIDARNPLQSTESARKGRHACIIYAFICAASASMSACILAKCASRSPAQRTTRCRTVSSAFVFIVFHLCPMQTV